MPCCERGESGSESPLPRRFIVVMEIQFMKEDALKGLEFFIPFMRPYYQSQSNNNIKTSLSPFPNHPFLPSPSLSPRNLSLPPTNPFSRQLGNPTLSNSLLFLSKYPF